MKTNHPYLRLSVFICGQSKLTDKTLELSACLLP
jgi:hypothetical protein